MHFDSDPALAAQRRHRLFIAVPLFALCLVISFSQTFWRQATLSEMPVTYAVQAEEGTLVHASQSHTGALVRLENGKILVAARGMVMVDVQGMRLTSWNGSFEVSVHDGRTIIAALTAPVLVYRDDTHIVPVGMQMTTGSLQFLPSHYLEKALRTADDLYETLPTADGGQLPEQLTNALAMNTEALLIPEFIKDADARLITLFHPAIQSKGWAVDDVRGSFEEELMLLQLLPKSDRHREAVSEVAVRLWQERLAVFSENDGWDDVGSATVNSLVDDVTALHEIGYPQRAKRYAEALLRAFPGSEHDETLRTIINGELLSAEPVTIPEESAEAPVIAEAVPPSPEVAKQMETDLRALLVQKGFMFTGRTILKAISTTRLAVDGVVLGTKSGDQLLRFQYDTVTGSVTQIEKDGQILPNSLPLEQYTEWVKGL